MATKGDAKPVKAGTDWELIERDYRAGVLSIREIAKRHEVSDTAIRKKAKAAGWDRATAVRQVITLAAEPTDEFDNSGFVYVVMLDSGLERFFKIGMAKHFSSRFSAHQCASPFPLVVACCYFVKNMRSEERELHDLFDAQRVRGEWFRLSGDDIAVIAARSILVTHD